MTSADHLNFLYETASSPIYLRIVNDGTLRAARNAARDFSSSLEGEIDPSFEILKRKVWRVFPEIQNSPISASSNSRLLQMLDSALVEIGNLVPTVSERILKELQSLERCFEAIKQRQSSPLLEELIKLIEEDSNFENYEVNPDLIVESIIAVSNLRIKIQLMSFLQEAGKEETTRVYLPRDFKSELTVAKQVVFVGPQFEMDTIETIINNSIIGRTTCLAHYNYIGAIDGLFENPIKPFSRVLRVSNIEYALEVDDDFGNSLPIEIDLDLEMSQHNLTESALDEIVECRVMSFQDGRFALFPNDDILEQSEFVDVLECDLYGNNVVSRILVDALEVESIVLMRAGATSTNSIIPEADKLMGKSAQDHRNNQNEWKKRLRERLNAVGVEAVNMELKSVGISRPYARNWSRDHLIRPLSDHNFHQLLKYLRFSEIERMAIFNSARIIRSAHQRAGMEITKSLKNAFAHVDLEKIYSLGTYSIKLEGDDEVMVVALIFEELSENLVKARLSQTRKLWTDRAQS